MYSVVVYSKEIRWIGNCSCPLDLFFNRSVVLGSFYPSFSKCTITSTKSYNISNNVLYCYRGCKLEIVYVNIIIL